MTYIPLARKWRPKSFADLVGQEHISRPLQNALAQQKLHQAYLFTGTRGVGKTTIARILAKALNCEQGIVAEPCLHCANCQSIDQGQFLDLIEVDAASRTRVEDTRELLENIQYAPTVGRFKIFLIDEVHMLSTHSFNALLKTLEEPPSHVKFLLATTDPQKIPTTILSRCLQFHLQALSPELISQQLAFILKQEKFDYELAALDMIANKAHGSMRDALSLCEQLMASFPLGFKAVELQDYLGLSLGNWLEHCLVGLIEQDGVKLIASCRGIPNQTTACMQMAQQLLAWLHELSIYHLAPDLVHTQNLNYLAHCQQHWSPNLVDNLYLKIEQSLHYLELSPHPLIGMQMLLLRLLHYLQAETKPSKLEIVVEVKPDEPETHSIPSDTPTKSEEDPKHFSTHEWTKILEQLEIDGIGKSALSHSTVVSFEQEVLSLELHNNYKMLFSPSIQTRITQALTNFYGRPIELSLKFTNTEQVLTPSRIKQQQTAEAKQELQQEIESHPFVREMIEQFQGEIIENSMTKISDDL